MRPRHAARDHGDYEVMDPAEVAALVIQTADRYAGPLVAGRFQVLGSIIGGSFYVVDHKCGDLLVRVAGPVSDIRRFISVEKAESWINEFTNGAVPRIDQPPPQETEMAKAARVVTETIIPPKRGPGRPPKTEVAPGWPVEAKRGGPKAAAPPDNVTKIPAAQLKAAKGAATMKAAATKVAATAKTTNGVPRGGRGLSQSNTLSAFVRGLILEGRLSDNEILQKTDAKFGKKTPRNAVKYYRGVLETRGLLG